MHPYPRNSPHAAGRLLALAMIADGHVCRSEVEAVERLGVEAALGLPPGGLAAVLQTLCEDLLHCAQMNGSLASCIDDELLDALIREVDDPRLQREVVQAIVAAASADGHLADGERVVLDALQRCWPQVATAGLIGVPA